MADDDGATWWEWDVDPLTREVRVDENDLNEIQERINDADELILQNTKFDFAMLRETYRDYGRELVWPWEKVRDTLYASHLLSSVSRHDLTATVLQYLGVNLQPFEDDVQKIVQACRQHCKGVGQVGDGLPDWTLAVKGLPCMPSARDKVWKLDMWLPRALAKLEERDESDGYWTICSEYANSDSLATLTLWKCLKKIIQDRKLEKIYEDRLQLLPVIPTMEQWGITVSENNLNHIRKQYAEEAENAAGRCCRVAARSGFKDLELPKSGVNNSLRSLLWGLNDEVPMLPVPVVSKSKKTGAPSLDKSALEKYEDILPPRSPQAMFLRNLRAKRKRDTAVNYMDGYKRFWLPTNDDGYYLLHPSFNPTGTNTLR